QAVSAQIEANALPFSTVELNGGHHLWPEVGKYGEIASFYHEWAIDKPGMKDIPAKVVHSTNLGGHQWLSEYVYDTSGQLCFAKLKEVKGKNVIERRFFYRDGWPIGVMEGSVYQDGISPEQTQRADSMLAQAVRLLQVEMAMSTIPSDPLE
ncbi:MAG: hypothetical protein HN348_24180, partial [Proteobacteria bacterium]|nr:hypothetical protein [Pseudomonadota bacterium]